MRQKGTKNKQIKALQITYPAGGFQNDVIRLLQKFVATESIRFSEFSRIWRESNFTLIYLGRCGIREHREFLEEAFKVLLKYIMPPYNLQVRVGGVYTMYSVYYTQKLAKKRRIRMPLSCWANFCELQQDVIDCQHLDAVYIIRKLISDRAFMLCAYPSMLSVDEVYLYDEEFQPASGDSASAQTSGLGEAPGLLAQIQDEDNIGQLHAVHEKYHQLKCEYNTLRGGTGHSPGTSLDLIRPQIAKSVLDIINKPKEKNPRAVIKGTVIETEADTSNERAKRLKALKDGALSSKVTPTRKSKQYEPEFNTDDEDGPKLSEDGWIIRKRGRPNLTPPQAKGKRNKSPEKLNDDASAEAESGSENATGERKRPRKSAPKKRISYNTDEDYEPDENDEVTKERNQPRRRSRSATSSNNDEEKTKSPQKIPPAKKPRKTNEPKPRALVKLVKKLGAIKPDTFVALRPGRKTGDQPIIGKVVTAKENEINVVYYKGDYNEPWTPITTMNQDDSEGKPLVEPIAQRNIIIAGFTLTKAGKLPANIKAALKKAMKTSE
ncbi:uncharacterized protein LOC120340527 [Styela clava]